MPPLERDTVAIPVTKGANPTTRARLLPAGELLEAKNSRFSGQGSEKRTGHTDARVAAGAYPAAIPEFPHFIPTLTPYGEKLLSADYLYGWGYITGPNDDGDNASLSGPYPEAGVTVGGASRDNELLTWNGHRLFSYTPSNGGQMAGYDAVMPALRASPIAKTNYAQNAPDACDSGRMRVVVALDPVTNATRLTILDSVTGATLVRDYSLDIVKPARVINMGTWFHVIGINAGNNLVSYNFNESNIATISTVSFGAASYWDVWKHDDSLAYVIKSTVGVADAKCYSIKTTGTVTDTINLDVNGEEVLECSVASFAATGRLGVVYCTSATSLTPNRIFGCFFHLDGTRYSSPTELLDFSATGMESHPRRVSVAPRWLYSGSGFECFDAYASGYTGTQVNTYSWYLTGSGLTLAPTHTAFHLSLASRAFRVGNRTYVWASNNSTLQSLWVLLDSSLKIVGAIDFAVANPQGYDDDAHLASVNFNTGTTKDRCVFQMALGYRVRVPTTSDQTGLYTEASVHYLELDFMPRLRAAQAGRCTYFAGAQLWQYDGSEVVEAGFHLAPEFTLTEDAGGALTALGTYSYRVDLCYRNAQNEEVRSHSLLVQTTLTGANQSIKLKIKPGLTRRENAYILVFRNAMVASAPTTTWNLINSRDPSSADFIINDQSVAFIDWEDSGAVTDTAGQSRELHPGNNSSFLYPFAAPACEIVAAGADRLWVAGGELPAGQIAPSRLFDPGEVPAFNANINRQVDRGNEPISAVGFIGGITVVFRPQAAYILDGDGPDNYASGYWSPARLALADSGAVSQESLALINGGLLFQSRAGIRAIGPGGAFTAVGQPMDDEITALTIRGAVVVPKFQEVRWYGDTKTVVYNYAEDAWSTWTVQGVGAVFNPSSGLAAVFVNNSSLWIESEGVYSDAGTPYEHRVRFPWLHAGGLGDFQRVRRISGIGEWDGVPHQVRVEMYYDEREHLAEYWDWDVPDTSQNTDTWGAATWGAGTWGDTANDTMHDSVWRWRRRPRRQKCSVFSVAVSDRGLTNTRGFVLTVLGLELAKKPGLDRVPGAGGTSANRG